MDKAILVLDMPKNCLNCKLQDWANCRIVKGCHTGENRPDWCPLKEVPERAYHENYCDAGRYDKGYNDCLDEILGGSKDE